MFVVDILANELSVSAVAAAGPRACARLAACAASSSSDPPARSARRRSTSSRRIPTASSSSGSRRAATAKLAPRRPRIRRRAHRARRRRGRAAGARRRRRRRAQRHHGLGRARPHARRARGRAHARARQQGVAHRRRRARHARRRARADRPGRLRALGHRAGAARGRRTRESAAWCSRHPAVPSAVATARSLADVTPAEALAHPTWDMGRVVTTNSATLVNKGLEVIEAHLLFDVPYDRIDVVVHPQSIVHSMVEFVDGSTIAQASPPDMRLPISLGLDWPHRVPGVGVRSTGRRRRLDFEPLDAAAFPRSRSPSASGARAAPIPPCSTPPTSRRSTPSTPDGSASSTSSTPRAGRRRARRAGSAHSRESRCCRGIGRGMPLTGRSSRVRRWSDPEPGTASARAPRVQARGWGRPIGRSHLAEAVVDERLELVDDGWRVRAARLDAHPRALGHPE